MRLPPDNSIRLPRTNTLLVARHDPPAPSTDDIANLLPAYLRDSDGGLRDVFLAAWGASANAGYHGYGRTLARIASPRYADGVWLDAWGDLFRRPRAIDEDDGAYRQRLLAFVDVVSPNAIESAVRALVSAATPVAPVFLEPAVDAAFFAPDSLDCPWAAFFQPDAQRLWADYPDRPAGTTAGAYFVSDTGPQFQVGIQEGAGSVDPIAYFEPDDGPSDPNAASFYAPDSDAFAFTFADDTSLLDRIIAEVDPKRAGGVPWVLFTEPYLAGAL